MGSVHTYEISDVSEKLYTKLVNAWCTTVDALQSILAWTQSKKQKTVITATYNNVTFDRHDIKEIKEFIEIHENWHPAR